MSWVRDAVLNCMFRLVVPTRSSVESALVCQLYGDERTYCNTPSEIICMIGLIASTALALINFSLVYTGRSLMHVCVAGSCLLGLHACRRVRRLVARQLALEEGIRKRDKIAEEMLSKAEAVKENVEEVTNGLEQQRESMTLNHTQLLEKVGNLIRVAKEDSDLAKEVDKLNSTIQRWIAVARQVEASNQALLKQIESGSSQPHQMVDLPDTRLDAIISELRDCLFIQLNGQPKEVVCQIGLQFINRGQEEDLPDLVKSAISALQEKVLPYAQGDAHERCQRIIDRLEALL
ncbi:MAG: hypothetical protein H7A40_06335 [Chlamydiales bacterium]|nr:hypothetical protein [Chlamydiales bacterium]